MIVLIKCSTNRVGCYNGSYEILDMTYGEVLEP